MNADDADVTLVDDDQPLGEELEGSDGEQAGDERIRLQEPVVSELDPGPETVVSHKDIPLEQLGLVINTEYKRIICLTCRRQVFSHRLYQHLRDHYKRDIPIPRDIASQIQQRFDINTLETPTHPQGPEAISAIFGLEIHDGYHFCGTCGRGYGQMSSLKTHLSEVQTCRPTDGNPPVTYHGYAQTFMTGPHRRFFRVNLHPPPPAAALSDYDLLLAHRPHLRLQDMPISLPANFEDLTNFLAREHWILHVEGFTPAELSALVSLPSPAEASLVALRPHVSAYLRKVQTLIPKHGSFGLLRTLADTGG